MKTLLDLHRKHSPLFPLEAEKKNNRQKGDQNGNGANILRKAAEAVLQTQFRMLSKHDGISYT